MDINEYIFPASPVNIREMKRKMKREKEERKRKEEERKREEEEREMKRLVEERMRTWMFSNEMKNICFEIEERERKRLVEERKRTWMFYNELKDLPPFILDKILGQISNMNELGALADYDMDGEKKVQRRAERRALQLAGIPPDRTLSVLCLRGLEHFISNFGYLLKKIEIGEFSAKQTNWVLEKCPNAEIVRLSKSSMDPVSVDLLKSRKKLVLFECSAQTLVSDLYLSAILQAPSSIELLSVDCRFEPEKICVLQAINSHGVNINSLLLNRIFISFIVEMLLPENLPNLRRITMVETLNTASNRADILDLMNFLNQFENLQYAFVHYGKVAHIPELEPIYYIRFTIEIFHVGGGTTIRLKRKHGEIAIN